MKRFEESNGIKEKSEYIFQAKPRKIRIKPLVSYYLKRLINSLTILQGIMTFCFLIFYFQNVINLDIIIFYNLLSILLNNNFYCLWFFDFWYTSPRKT